MSIVSVAIIGRNNEPLYLREFSDAAPSETELFGLSLGDTSCSIRHQFILQEALERLKKQEASGFPWRTAGATGSDAKFVGLLYPVEDLRCYGYITATKVKIIAAVEDDVMSEMQQEQQEKDSQIKSFLSQIHNLYIEYLLNPFNEAGEHKIISKQFDMSIDSIAKSFNQEF